VPLDDDFHSLVGRLAESDRRVRALIGDGEVDVPIQAGRHLDPGHDEGRISEPARCVARLGRFGHQHRVVDFSISSDLTAYAADPHVEFDLDEDGDE
jgi:hypothetical protein